VHLLSDLVVDDVDVVFSAAPEDHHRSVDVLLDGRRIWSFRIGDAVPDESGQYRMPWPAVVLPYLDGKSTFTLRPVDGGSDVASVVAGFGEHDHPVRFTDSHGLGLMVNKWGNIGHAISDYPPGIEQRLLDRLDLVRKVLADRTDVDVYVTGGTLLGPYRDGRVMPNDDDADLAYLSRHRHPTDVAREGFRIGRELVAAGVTVVRCSAGHLQLHFEHEGRPDGYVDVFTGWIDDAGWWYQLFPIRARVQREQLVPPRTLDIQGRPQPMCREPEVMLEAIYGPAWAVPDPAFTFEVPRTTADRFYGWMSDQHMDRALWEGHHRYDVVGDRVELGSAPTDYVRSVADRLDPGAPVVELGAGRGHDALWLAGQGHPVEAIDYVRGPMVRAAEFAASRELPARFRTLNLYDPRRVLAFGAEMATSGKPVTIYARDLLATMWDVGRPTLFRLLSMLLRGGGAAHLDVPHRSLRPDPRLGGPLHRAVDPDMLAVEMASCGLAVVETSQVEEDAWPGARQVPEDEVTRGTGDVTAAHAGDVPMTTTRMVVSWQRARR
jgi:hypothetical protein